MPTKEQKQEVKAVFSMLCNMVMHEVDTKFCMYENPELLATAQKMVMDYVNTSPRKSLVK